jgi:hypothetical protein
MEDLGKSLPVSEGIVDAEQAGNTSGEKNCLNCGAELQGIFCHSCGQKNLPRRQNIGDLFVNFVSSFYSFESKFFKTFKFLLFRPGRIINDYNEGKRESYYHPARMYVFLSFIFFLVLSLVPDEDKINFKDDGRDMSREEKARFMDSLKVALDSMQVPINNQDWSSANWSDYDPKTVAEYDSIENLKPEKDRDNGIERYFSRKFIQLKEESGDDDKALMKRFLTAFLDNIPKMIFFLLPVFALILKLLYIRRDFYYSEHLVFSVMYYDFMYLIGIVGLLCSLVSWLDWVSSVLTLIGFFYLYKAMRKVYKQPRAKTILKFFLLTGTFFFCLVMAFAINAVITLILM